MKITARIFSAVSIALLLLTILLTLGMTVMQNSLIRLFADMPEIMDGFEIPWEILINTVLWLAAVVILCVGINTEKTGIAFEIVFMVLAVLLLPSIFFVWNQLERFLITPLIYRTVGNAAMTRRSVLAQVFSYATVLQPLALSLSYLACGISLGRKCTKKSLSKKMQSQ